jgi:hypothetical protein
MPLSKKIILVFVVFLLIVVLAGLIMPSQLEINEKIEINNDQASVYNQLNNLKTWQSWSKWSEASSEIVNYQYGVHSSGNGAKSTWKESGKEHSIQITKSDSASRIFFLLNFGGELNIENEIEISNELNFSSVQWTASADLGFNLVGRLFLPFVKNKINLMIKENLKSLKKELELRQISGINQMKRDSF